MDHEVKVERLLGEKKKKTKHTTAFSTQQFSSHVRRRPEPVLAHRRVFSIENDLSDSSKPYRGVSLLLSHHAGEIAALKARKTHLFEQFYTKMHHFTKTGSGQT
jgi:hypothetical protein